MKYIVMQLIVHCHALSFIIRNALVRFVNLENSVVVWMYGGSERHSEVPVKLNDFLPNEVLTEGRLSWDVEDERVL